MGIFGMHASMIAHLTGSITAQRVAAGLSDELRDAVLGNSHCDPGLWCELYQTKGPGKLPPAIAKTAVSGYLTDDQVKHLLATETRGSVLSTAFDERCPATETLVRPQLRKLLGEERFTKKITKAYAHALDFDLLATVPAAELNENLRVWRLLSRSLPDGEILEQLRCYGTWASGYVQAPVGWVIHQRPHLVTELVDCDSLDVRTQIAASPHLGRLDVEQQRTLLYLDTDATEAGEAWLNERVFLWMAAVANPTARHELVDALTERLEAQTREFGAARNSRNRKEYNNWSVTSVADAVQEHQLDRIIRWAAPYNGKTKPHAIAELIRNPSLDDASAERVAQSVQADLGQRALWRTDEARAVLVAFADRFPQVAATYQLVDIWDHLRTGLLQTPPPERPLADADPDAGDRVTRWSLTNEAAIRWLDERIGDSEETWRKVFELVDTLEQATLEELVVTCQALSVLKPATTTPPAP